MAALRCNYVHGKWVETGRTYSNINPVNGAGTVAEEPAHHRARRRTPAATSASRKSSDTCSRGCGRRQRPGCDRPSGSAAQLPFRLRHEGTSTTVALARK
jgi:hypothetical protein